MVETFAIPNTGNLPAKRQNTDFRAVGLEFLRLALMSVCTLYAYRAFVTAAAIGNSDAHWYHNILADALEQGRSGIFPVYVGQGEYNFVGIPLGRAPYYFLLSGLIDLLSVHQLSSIQVQHGVVLVSALAGSLLMYTALSRLAPTFKWQACLLSILYVSCPGVIGVIAKCDMYFSFCAMPFVPILLFGTMRCLREADAYGVIAVGSALSLLWMAHPPIALWCTFLTVLLLSPLLLSRKGIKQLALVGVIFLLLSCWQLVTVVQQGVGQSYSGVCTNSLEYARLLVDRLQADCMQALLPVEVGLPGIPYLQLGYSLWLLLICACVAAVKARRLELSLLCLAASILMVLLNPISRDFAVFIWRGMPSLVANITTIYIAERFYIIAAALICFSTILSLSSSSSFWNRASLIALMIMVVWNLVEANKFVKHVKISTTKIPTPTYWIEKQNAFVDHAYLHPDFRDGSYLPAGFEVALDQEFKPITALSNTFALQNLCVVGATAPAVVSFCAKNTVIDSDRMRSVSLFRTNLSPRRNYIVWLKIDACSADAQLEVLGERKLNQIITNPVSRQTILFVPFNADDGDKDEGVAAFFHLLESHSSVRIIDYGVTSYDSVVLPIHIRSYIPYIASLTNTSGGRYLETGREFVPGYTATVNALKIEPLRSPRGKLMVPVVKGVNVVCLHYEGTEWMRLALMVSLVSWSILVAGGVAQPILSLARNYQTH